MNVSGQLSGQPVLVHPDVAYDPLDKQGQVGKIMAVDLAVDDVFVEFADGRRGLYASDALLVFLPEDQIHQNVADSPETMPWADLKDITLIDLTLRYGKPPGHIRAMEKARDNPAIHPLSLESLANRLARMEHQSPER